MLTKIILTLLLLFLAGMIDYSMALVAIIGSFGMSLIVTILAFVFFGGLALGVTIIIGLGISMVWENK